MESNQIPADVQERIKADAETWAFDKPRSALISHHRYGAYIAGATAYAPWKVKYDELVAENERLKARISKATKNVRAIASWAFATGPKVKCNHKDVLKEVVNDAFNALTALQGEVIDPEALKEGESNTPATVPDIEYMPILSAELRELKGWPNVPVRVPMHLLNAEQADRNHGQTLQRLKERGGVGIKEALSLITLKNWSYYRDLPMKEAIALLNDLIENNNPH